MILCDEEGIAFLAKGFGPVELGSLAFLLAEMLNRMEAVIWTAGPMIVPPILSFSIR